MITVAKLDGIRRMTSYRRLDGFPIIVAAGLSTDEIYGQWQGYAKRSIAALAFFLFILAWLGRKLLRQLAIRERLELQLNSARDHLAQANAELSALAWTDGLTRLANRRAFDTALERELARARREGGKLSLLMIDVDFFKPYNDNYGHPEGDVCLQRVAKALATRIARPPDLVARYGGEEFIVLLSGTDAAGAATVAEHLRDAVAALRIPHGFSPAGTVTISVGGTSMDLAARQYCKAADLAASADAALYEAKQGGRNQVRMLECVSPAQSANAVARDAMR